MAFLSMFSNSKSTGIFVPDKTGFVELKDEIQNKSIVGISEHLGYHPDQVFSYIGPSDDIHAIVFEIFTTNILFVSTKDTVTKLSTREIDNYVKKFLGNNEYNSFTVNSILEEGIKNRSLRVEFLARVADIKNASPDGIFFVEKFGLYFYFVDGYLTDISSSDGLNEWAKHFKEINPKLIADYEKVAKKFWGDDIGKVIKEVNAQADALAETPDAVRNEFVPLHCTPFGTTNYVMLLVCHYNYPMNVSRFKEINKGRYVEMVTELQDDLTNVRKYSLDRFLYEFDESGELSNVSMKNK